MGVLKGLLFLFIVSFPVAEVGRIQFSNGIAISLNDVLLVALIIVWAIIRWRKNRVIKKSTLTKPIIAFSLIALGSLILNFSNLGIDKFLVSFLYLVRWAAYASLYYIIKDLNKGDKFRIDRLLLFSGFLVVFFGFIQYFLYPNLRNLYYLGWDEHLYRLFSTFLDPNFAGTFFALYFLYTVNYLRAFAKKNKVERLVVSLISLLTLLALYLTYSRSALLMLLVGIMVYLFIIDKKKLILIAVLVVLLMIPLLPKSFKTEGTNFLRIASSGARLSAAQDALVIFQKSPLYGIGFNAYRYAQNRQGLLSSKDWRITHSGAGTDNSFLFVLATTGIIGFAFYLYLLLKIYNLGSTNLKRSKYASVLIPVLLGLITNSLFLNSLFYVLILEWVWVLASLTESS